MRVHKGYIGIYQQDEDERTYLEVLCVIDADSEEISYEAYFQNPVTEEAYVGAQLMEDGTLLLIDTLQNTLTTSTYEKQFIVESTHKFQPDQSVYSKSGIMGFTPTTDRGRKVTLSLSGSTLTESYQMVGRNHITREDYDVAGLNTYKRISDTK